ncbi:MAG: PTS sugar transporter subunit IIB [Cetobacterium sp.]|uniref:PTS sugar transporter subunit IIB n=1 Tax=Cetobacterium sp. TaxID=2071632 RepID=UPI003EE5B5C7
MKILLVCSGGMSSAMVVKALVKEGQKEGLEITSKAVGTGDFETELKNGWDGALVAPQIRHKIDEFKAIGAENNTPVEVIETKGYSPLGGKFLLAQVKGMIK